MKAHLRRACAMGVIRDALEDLAAGDGDMSSAPPDFLEELPTSELGVLGSRSESCPVLLPNPSSSSPSAAAECWCW